MSHPDVTCSPPLLIQPAPQPDWDHARSQRLVLRSPDAQWAAAAVSECLPDGFWAPACLRDDDGLSWRLEGPARNYLDRIAFRLCKDDQPVPLSPLEVEATPEYVTYRYSAGGAASLAVSYALVQEPESGRTTLCVHFLIEGASQGWMLQLKPNLDMRAFGAPPDPTRHRVNPADEQHLSVVNNNHWLGFRFERPVRFVPGREQRDVSFPLGRGERLSRDEKVVFVPTRTRVFIPGQWQVNLDTPLRLDIQAGRAEPEMFESLDAAAPHLDAWRSEQFRRYEDFCAGLAVADERLRHRAYVMAEKLWVRVGEQVVPDTDPSGERVPQMRATLEGLRHNGHTLLKLNLHPRLERIIRACLGFQDPLTGRFPSRWPENPVILQRFEKSGRLPAEYYDAGDIGLLLFTLLDEVPLPFSEPDTTTQLWTAFKRMFNGFKKARTTRRLSGPVLLESGLLLTVPHHSWMDGKRAVFTEKLTVTDLPTRCPSTWHIQDVAQFRDSHYTWEQYQYPTFYLPEVNALWLRSLHMGLSLARQADESEWIDELTQVHSAALANYKPVFWNNAAQFLYNVVSLDRRIDGTPSAAAVEAAALLGESVFTRIELEKNWQLARNRLLIHREGVAWGLLAKDSSERVYQERAQLHEAVVHPRETAYLAQLLRMLGQEATRLEVLNSLLTHQDSEGAVFYTQEALALPESGNPSPEASQSGLPVPVRATGAWWSQFCDVFMEQL